MRKYIFCFALLPLFFMATGSNAQDPQFSQFYAAPLYINPAFAGSTQMARAGVNFRNQWPSIDASFVTYSAYFDYFWEKYNSGVGLILMNDREGSAGLTSTTVGFNYAYQLYINNSLVFRPGFSASFVSRALDFDKLTFGNQFDPITGRFDTSVPTGEAIGDQTTYFDLGLGGLLYGNNFWVGVAVSHITEPNQSFFDDGESGLPMKTSIHAGYKFPLPVSPRMSGRDEFGRERSITPNMQYKTQGEFDQLDLGVYVTWEPLVIGVNYRGLPIDGSDGVSRNESVILILGYSAQDIKVGYSYDFTISALGLDSGGAHEVTFSYQFPLAKDRLRPPRHIMQIPCPNF